MSSTFIVLPINNDYFGDDIEAIRASINSAIDYCFDKHINEVHVITNNPDIIIKDLSEFNVIRYFKLCGRDEWKFIIRLRSAGLKSDTNPVPDANSLTLSKNRSEAESLILSFLAEKINKANNNGWDTVIISHKIPKNIIDILESEKHYKIRLYDDRTVISWEV